MNDKPTPDQAVRLLRAKGAELEAQVHREHEANSDPYAHPRDMRIAGLAADIALVAQLLADHIERATPTLDLYVAHTENLIERVYALEVGDAEDPPQIIKPFVDESYCTWPGCAMRPALYTHPDHDGPVCHGHQESGAYIHKPEVW